MLLSTREKFLIAVMVVLFLITGGYYGVGGLETYERDIQAQLEVREVFSRRAVLLAEQIREQERLAPKATSRRRPLIGFVEQLTNRLQLKGRVQLNLIPQEKSTGMQGIQLKVDNLTLDEMVELVYTLEDAKRPLIIDRFEVSPSFRTKKRLRLSMRILSRG